MKDLKEIWYGLCAVAHAAWEIGTDLWDVASTKQRTIVYAIILGVSLLFVTTCVYAADEPDAAYTVIAFNTPTGEQRFLCHLAKGVPVTGEVSLCLFAEPVSPQMMMTSNWSIWCAVNAIHASGAPGWTCGSWEQIQEKLTGI